MRVAPPKSTGQLLFGSVIIILTTLGLILLFKDLARRAPQKSRVDWPASTKP